MAALAGPAFAQSVGCATPSSMAHYFAPQFQSCAGTSVAVSETTLYARWNANTSHSLSCGSQTGGMLRYNNGGLELCDGTNWSTLASSASPQDRIVSGTSSVFVAGGGAVSVTVAGSNVANFGTDGKIGLATPNPSSTLHIYDTGDITTSSYAGITIGTNTGSNLGIDNNEIVAKSNGSPSPLYLNMDGGAVYIGTNTKNGQIGVGQSVASGVSVEVSGTISATNVYSAGVMKMGKYAAQPVACSATYDGMIALTSARRMCICDATSWKEINSATACTW